MSTAQKIVSSAAVAALFGISGIALAAPVPPHGSGPVTAPGQNKILCFDGTTDGGFGGTCTLNSNGAKGTATLALTSSNPNGDYAGVYTQESSIYGATLASLKQLSYHYTASITPQPGNLSYNIPIDTDGNGSTDGYAFVDAFYCPGTGGNVDIVNDPNCGIWLNGVEYANWAALVAAFPNAKVATDNFAFIVAERTGTEPAATYTVNNVKFGKPGK
ncbi:hypothetical protein KW798_03135 [Candidatus Parcubacteria bacterium]|nr:hypothetical protein [Candidatus Parcubacteria bacterium]